MFCKLLQTKGHELLILYPSLLMIKVLNVPHLIDLGGLSDAVVGALSGVGGVVLAAVIIILIVVIVRRKRYFNFNLYVLPTTNAILSIQIKCWYHIISNLFKTYNKRF